MDTLHLIASATGLGFLAGFRLYATVLALGLAIRFNLLDLRAEFQSLEALANWWVIGVAGAAFLIEFFADKIPWVDTAWDALHTFIRPVGATLLAITAMGDVSPVMQVVTGLLAGGVALTTHSGKAATRLAVNHSPEPLSNSILSLAEDAAVPVGVWLTMEHPLVLGGIVAAFLVLLLILAPMLYRLVRFLSITLFALFRSWFSGAGSHSELEEVPEKYARHLREKHSVAGPVRGLRVVAREGNRKAKNSIGFLVRSGDALLFATRRWFGHRVIRIPLGDIANTRYREGFLFDRLMFDLAGGTMEYSVFKDGSGQTGALLEGIREKPAAAAATFPCRP